MIAVSEAIDIVKRGTEPLGTEIVEIVSVVGRILAEDIVADSDLPPFDRSQMDGFALRSEDVLTVSAKLRVVGESSAGHGWHHKLNAGEAVRIMTGAPVPKGADAVQKVELTDETNGIVRILELVQCGKNIVPKGSETRLGDVVVTRGQVITAKMIASVAAFGYWKVKVAKQPRVAVIGTGSEIVEIAEEPGRDQIRNSNSIMLDVLARGCGATTSVLPNVKDEISNLKSQLTAAAKVSDILIITGGVSVGKYDLTKLALAELGAEIYFEKLRLKPGKPAVFARLGHTLVFGLPGNPVSAAVTFHLLVRLAILKMQGASFAELRQGFAVLASPVKAARERDTYLPAKLESDAQGRLIAEPTRWRGSSDFIGFANAEALVFVPGGESRSSGDVVVIKYL